MIQISRAADSPPGRKSLSCAWGANKCAALYRQSRQKGKAQVSQAACRFRGFGIKPAKRGGVSGVKELTRYFQRSTVAVSAQANSNSPIDCRSVGWTSEGQSS